MKKIAFLSVNSTRIVERGSVDRINLDQLTTVGELHASSCRAISRIAPSAEFANLFPIPKYNGIASTFADVTDLQADRVRKQAEGNDLPIVVYWSGGIDSTVILSAIIKHFPVELLKRVIVRMTNASYIENPYFFKHIILKYNLKYSSSVEYDFHNAIILHGDPADLLWIRAIVLSTQYIAQDAYKINIRKHPDIFFKWMAHFSTHDKNFNSWVYEFIMNHKTPDGVTIETLSDVIWWINFNYDLDILKHLGTTNQKLNGSSLSLFMQNFANWYGADDYQLWSMHNQHNDVKFNGTTQSYKMPAKEYIFDLDKNQHYRDYKTKLASRYDCNASILESVWDDGTIILSDGSVIPGDGSVIPGD